MTLTMNPHLMDLSTPTAVLKAVVAPLSDIMTKLPTTPRYQGVWDGDGLLWRTHLLLLTLT